jgi:Holliday junction resolvase-like predicted endonuclease
MMPDYKKIKGYKGEEIVADHYTAKGYKILNKNYTIQ